MDTHPDIDPSYFEVPPWIRIVRILRAAEFHWHFCQGIRAIDSELYIPGSLSLLAGIEASIRFTLYQMTSSNFPFEEDLGTVLCNSLLRQAQEVGMPVTLLAFPGETDFPEVLKARKPEAQIVKIRNYLAHGNSQAFVNRELGDENVFFTPECLRPTAEVLWDISFRWAEGLATFRAARKA